MNSDQQKGLSLIEIMITLVIVAIIAGIAYPRYQRMVSKSKQVEAKTILQSIHMGQDLHKTANEVFTNNLDDLDIQIPSDTKYAYSVTISGDGSSFIAKAVANIDGDSALDEWQIDQDNNLVNTVNDVIEQ
ncbi:prepilin-type N-terminal cleavage/methylation domain-containing protein [bacterium]|nr:prepilin-type N-terminal cleavage/methylation domain-containing protein [bacterium]